MPVVTRSLRQVLEPLVGLADRLPVADRRAWLDDLRLDAPVLVAVLETLLEERRLYGDDQSVATPANGPPDRRTK